MLWGYTPAYMGSLPIHGKPSHICEVSPHTRRLPTYGETPHTWGVSPYLEYVLAGKLKFVSFLVFVFEKQIELPTF
jgi:hypothetical protein